MADENGQKSSGIRRKYWLRRISSLAHKAGRFGARIGASRIVLLLVLALPALLIYGISPPRIALWVWFGLVVLLQVLNTYQKGDVRLDLERRTGIVNSALSGDIDSLTQRLLNSADHRLTEEQAKMICMGLLQRVRQYAEIVLDATVETRLRATLAVPILSADSEVVSHLRVWCYDASYDDRRWSKFPMGVTGSPKAFATGRIVIINDLWALTDLPGESGRVSDRRFRSVVSIPVTLGGPDGERIAVVNLDAPPPNYFDVNEIESRLLPGVIPIIACIALVLVNLQDGAIFEFGR